MGNIFDGKHQNLNQKDEILHLEINVLNNPFKYYEHFKKSQHLKDIEDKGRDTCSSFARNK